MSPARTMAMTSVRICGDVSLRNTPFRALSASCMVVYWLKVACGPGWASAFSSVQRGGAGVLPLCIEVRDQLAFHPGDLILQHELALLEALQLQLVGMDVERQAGDHLVQVPMINAQRPQLLYVAEQQTVDD